MPTAPASLTSGNDTTDATSYATASVTPSPKKLVLIAVYNRISAGTANTPTITGNGLTWVSVGGLNGSGANTIRRLSLFRAMGNSPSAGAITIDFAGQTQLHCVWSVIEWDFVDQGGTNGSAAIVQAATTDGGAGGTSGSVTLSAFAAADNATYGAFFHAANEASTAGSGFTKIHDVQQAENNVDLMTEYLLANDTSADASWTTSTTYLAIAAEIKHSLIHKRRTLSRLGARAGSRAA